MRTVRQPSHEEGFGASQVRGLECEIRGVREECDKLLSQQRHLQSKLHALEEELGRIHSKVTPTLP